MEKGIFALLAFGVGFVVAQLWKFVVGILTEKPKLGDFKTAVGYLTRSGGMPSGHAASMTAASTYLGCIYGFSSGIFALAVATTIIVIYDAIHVRYAVGEQGKVLNTLSAKKLAVTEGHTLSQAVVGALLGVVIGVAVAFL